MARELLIVSVKVSTAQEHGHLRQRSARDSAAGVASEQPKTATPNTRRRTD